MLYLTKVIITIQMLPTGIATQQTMIAQVTMKLES